MSPKTPSDPQKGKPARDEQAELEAAEAKPSMAGEAAEEKTEDAPKRKAPAKKPAVKKKPIAKKPVAEEKPVAQAEPVAEQAQPATEEPEAAAERPEPAAEEPEAVAGRPEPGAEEPEAAAERPEPGAEEPEAVADESEAAPELQTQTRAPARRKVVRAQARYVRTSARKARMVCGHLRGKPVSEARAILAFTPRDVARDWAKLLESAVANAENNHELLEDDLVVHEAYADEGPTIKRFRPRAQGRATPIRKRTSHLTITLTPNP
jgi:ribosomal protein L22